MIDSGIVVGPFLVDRGGGISLREANSVANFAFVWRGRPFAAELDQDGLRLSAQLGRVPSSLGGAARRADALATVHGMRAALPEQWQARLTPDHHLEFAHAHGWSMPVTADELMVPVTQLLLALQPYLDLLDEAGIDPPALSSPASAAGNANVWPG